METQNTIPGPKARTIFNCRKCHSAWTLAAGTAYPPCRVALKPDALADKYGWHYCIFCGHRTINAIEIRGKITGQDCNAVCWSAMGEQCKCKCGGTRHAAAYELLAEVAS